VGIDARLDLHGKTQAQAHGELLRFLRRAQSQGAKFVLVITGKGSLAPGDGSERGVLRRQVPLWLSQPQLRNYVTAFERAHVAHGGEGAFYVRLRRIRRADVSRMVEAGRIETVWKVLDAATTGHAAKAIGDLDHLLASGEYPVMVLAALTTSLLKIHRAGRLRALRMNLDEACRIAESCPHLGYGGHIEVRQVDQM